MFLECLFCWTFEPGYWILMLSCCVGPPKVGVLFQEAAGASRYSRLRKVGTSLPFSSVASEKAVALRQGAFAWNPAQSSKVTLKWRKDPPQERYAPQCPYLCAACYLGLGACGPLGMEPRCVFRDFLGVLVGNPRRNLGAVLRSTTLGVQVWVL